MILQALSQNIPIAVLEALLFMGVAAWIGWWLGSRALNARIDSVQTDIAAKQVELEICRQQKSKPKAAEPATAHKLPVIEVPMDISSPEAIPGINSFTAAPILVEEADDLKIIEGIGPKIEQLLNNEGIKTFATLASTPPSRITEILQAAGPRYQIHDPGTWPDQARLAADGKWEELKIWQDELNKGKKA
ncbi:hypothetical protein [Siphonobacter aquaeclarae]|jgi:predicted flap endonuclease-1-like 5' DNA nuclease|uniref:Predicted 5' DNA nuclease, flap endonuclease-1-like, helix-3-turn-helix (H3TH) domain n=1 Tax=Siphonobacter aquaeclarae TaxID=563176 RepID=A0A1G9TC88_9BACT|nr:hypothetical protein [Siphonobacter aquaeclarae]MBO9636776.1 hypothetical protein [Siphonobacter aquaeclarae]SDM45238.1 Predicted 5' DNA nuclease, flap endonuclease-1-like, helix-3-turn-helix (H3TH) domain [Siphonobacter aquaeclarae]